MDSYVGSALTNLDGARALAKKIFDIYDRDKSGIIEAHEIGISRALFFRRHDD